MYDDGNDADNNDDERKTSNNFVLVFDVFIYSNINSHYIFYRPMQ